MNKDKFTVKGRYDFKIIGVDGKVRDSWTVENLVVNGGLAFLSGLLNGTGTVPTYIAVGTSSTAVAGSQTTLVAETTTNGLERAVGTTSQETTTVSNDTWQITKTFTATGTVAVEEVGVFNAASGGTMLSRALTGSKSVDSGEQLVSTYQLVFANA